MNKIFTILFILSLSSIIYSEESVVENIKSNYDLVMARNNWNEIKIYISDLRKRNYTGIERSICNVFEGSLLSKLADISILFWDKIYYINEGIKKMRSGMSEIMQDTSNSLSEKDLLTLHLIYGITSGYIPDVFQSKKVSIQELETAINMNGFDLVDKKVQVETYILLSEGYKKIGNNEKSSEFQSKAEKLDNKLYYMYKNKK